MMTQAVTSQSPQLPTQHRASPPTWDEIADSFETLGKVGLAMAIGFSAAGLFCRLAQQGKVKVPNLAPHWVNSVTAVTEPRKSKS